MKVNTALAAPRFMHRPRASSVVSLAAIALLACSAEGFAQSPPPAVSVEPVSLENIAPSTEFVGRVEAVNTVDIRARVDGFIQDRLFAEGQLVKKDQDLFVIEKAPYEATLMAAKANLASAQATLGDAERRLQRNQQLRRTQSVAQATLEEIQTARDTAQAAVDAAQATVRQAEINLQYTTIQAPFAGRIGSANFSVGSFVGPSSTALARIVEIDPIRVVFSVSDRVLLDLRTNSGNVSKDEIPAGFVPTLRLSNGQNYPGNGRIEFFGNELDPRTGTLPVRAFFSNPDGLLIPGQFVTVVVRTTQERRRPVVPVGAVQLDRDGRFVLILDKDSRVVQQRIRTGVQIGQNWTVDEGLKGGETLVVQGGRTARPGTIVRVVPPSENPAAPLQATGR
ncbi:MULTISPECIES: efflux RND transporter periplasmic adaptor subunit [unclassified Beijerinckia]|uniref:efflux RND transporter periplasmic adaptor subunit n=1 Tax=unclassified Beijerinckia TaxID=2638183 RepID=UPI00089D3032|nr:MULTISPECIES: efflux RND transporter periplasmic adaptor subunit [unclassified Beijerinckia]MDH7798861.1 membrane fusion protein (multidrug efflux system) [Beijerinckia sp. GAS462]SED88682.1 membrane fusion protein, multidrug efflux system [Beijerinckia sp. 28-YEA-48]